MSVIKFDNKFANSLVIEKANSLVIDLDSGLVTEHLANRTQSLSNHLLGRNELKLLRFLFTNKCRPISRDELMTQIWKGRFVGDNTLSVTVSKVRRLLERVDCSDDIKTISCYGYMFDPANGKYKNVAGRKVQVWSKGRDN